LPLAMDPIPATQGSQISVSGRGFAEGEPVTVTASKSAAGTDVVLGGGLASGQGTLDSLVLALPDQLESGPHPIVAVGQISGRRNTGTLWIRARDPWLALSTYELQPRADLGLILGGFEPQESVRVTVEARADKPSIEPVVLSEIATD